jgi:hypothetical protein
VDGDVQLTKVAEITAEAPLPLKCGLQVTSLGNSFLAALIAVLTFQVRHPVDGLASRTQTIAYLQTSP